MHSKKANKQVTTFLVTASLLHLSKELRVISSVPSYFLLSHVHMQELSIRRIRETAMHCSYTYPPNCKLEISGGYFSFCSSL